MAKLFLPPVPSVQPVGQQAAGDMEKGQEINVPTLGTKPEDGDSRSSLCAALNALGP